MANAVAHAVAEKLCNYYFAKYIKDFKDRISFFPVKDYSSSEIQLHGVELKQGALDELQLPIAVRHGIIGSLTINIPWETVLKVSASTDVPEPTVLIDDVLLIAQPLSSFDTVAGQVDADFFERAWQKKKQKIEKHAKRWAERLARRWTGTVQSKAGWIDVEGRFATSRGCWN